MKRPIKLINLVKYLSKTILLIILKWKAPINSTNDVVLIYHPILNVTMKRLFTFMIRTMNKSVSLACFQMIVLNDLEERHIQLYKQRSDMIVTRRQEDVKDQCMEYSTSKLRKRTQVLI